MNILDIIVAVFWGFLGIVNLVKGDISRFSYGCVWVLLMFYLIGRCFGLYSV